MPFGAKKKAVGVGDFKREDDLEEDGKSKCSVNKRFPCHTEAKDTERNLISRPCPHSPASLGN